MSDISDYLNTYVATEYIQYATEYADGVTLLNIGDEILSPSDKCYYKGVAVYDQVLADGSAVDSELHPVYYAGLELSTSELSIGDAIDNGGMRGIYFDGTNYWIATTDFMVYEVSTEGEQLRSFSVYWESANYGYPQGIIVTDGVVYTVHTANSQDDSLRAWDPDTGDNIGYYAIADDVEVSTDMGYSEQTGHVYVVDVDEDSLAVVEMTLAGVYVATYTTDITYNGITFDTEGNAYASMVNDDTGYLEVYLLDDNFLPDTLYIGTEYTSTTSIYWNGEIGIPQSNVLHTYGKYLPNLDSGSDELPYRVVVDLQEE